MECQQIGQHTHTSAVSSAVGGVVVESVTDVRHCGTIEDLEVVTVCKGKDHFHMHCNWDVSKQANLRKLTQSGTLAIFSEGPPARIHEAELG